MTVSLVAVEAMPATAEMVVVAVHQDLEWPPGAPQIDRHTLELRRFGAKLGELVVESIPGESRLAAVVGLGSLGSADSECEALRRAGAALVRAAGDCRSAAVMIPAEARGLVGERLAARCLAEGILLASYNFDRYKSDPRPARLDEVALVSPDQAEANEGLKHGSVLGTAVCLARDLINEPPSVMTPTRFCSVASSVGAESGLTVEIWDEARIRSERLGGLLAVAAGSKQEPRFLRLSYVAASGDPKAPVVALVGKGITFDSGGLSLKPAEGMMTMKTDMSGAATVLAAMTALRPLGVEVGVVGLMPLTENMPGGGATKPGDVFTARNGKTIEVLNTDAEGRLVLADALSLAAEASPAAIIDLATLTGACVVALGREVAGLFSNSEELKDRVTAASEIAGEPVWPLPLQESYREHIDSEIADMKNIGAAGQAGAISAALLLSEFVGKCPWVHLDIAGPARSYEDKGYLRKGGTGYGVRTLVEMLLAW